MASVDTVVRVTCHEIFGFIAVQHTQDNVRRLLRCAVLLAGLTAPVVEAREGTIAHTTPNDPLLDGGPPGPCAELAEGPDYAGGTDVNGRPVVPADVGAAPVPVPGAIAVPLPGGRRAGGPSNPVLPGAQRPYVSIDGARLAPLLNPPRCQPH